MKRNLGVLALAVALCFSGAPRAENGSITQAGADNVADVTQDTNLLPELFGASSATVVQTGDRNQATIDQGNAAAVSAGTSSTGNDNTATISQTGQNSAGAGIVQTGNGNEASVIQFFANSAQGHITQQGNGSHASIDQDSTNNSGASLPDGASATIEQLSGGFGGQNNASISQHGLSLRTSAHILQNDALQATATVDQSGNDLIANVTQGIAIGGIAHVMQRGSSNTATVDQRFTANQTSASIDQSGSGNNATVLQYFNANNNSAVVNQSGMLNSASVTQSGDPAFGGVCCAANWNSATVLQSGDANVATLQQTGQGTAASPNVALINQTSSGNAGHIAQSGGAGNHATLTQH